MTLDSGRDAGAVMWMTCLPRRSESREEELEDGVACLFAGLKPAGALYGFDADKFALEVYVLAYQISVFQ